MALTAFQRTVCRLLAQNRTASGEELGKCVLDLSGELFRGSPDELVGAMRRGSLLFHAGKIRGAMPRLKG